MFDKVNIFFLTFDIIIRQAHFALITLNQKKLPLQIPLPPFYAWFSIHGHTSSLNLQDVGLEFLSNRGLTFGFGGLWKENFLSRNALEAKPFLFNLLNYIGCIWDPLTILPTCMNYAIKSAKIGLFAVA